MKKPFKKIGKRNSMSLDLPDHRNRVRIKSITYTKQGIIDDLKCPECEGEGVDFIDNTHSKGGEMIPRLCNYCDGKGNVNEDMILDIKFDNDGNQHIIYKEGDKSHDSNR
tara:strand:+ start:57 stop:386 length:330 start_codon:yes stop_codon:yes gene_type:complete